MAITDMLGNISIWDLAMQYGDIAAMFLGVLLLLAVGLMIAYKIKAGQWFAHYPISVQIWELRGNTPIPTGTDKARAILEHNGIYQYELKKRKVTTQAYSFSCLTPNNHLYLLAMGRDEYHPFNIITAKGKVISHEKELDGSFREKEVLIPQLQPVISEAAKMQFAIRTEKNLLRFNRPSWLSQYGPIIGVVLAGMIIFLLIAVFLKDGLPELTQMVNMANAASQSWAEATKTCGLSIATPAPSPGVMPP